MKCWGFPQDAPLGDADIAKWMQPMVAIVGLLAIADL